MRQKPSFKTPETSGFVLSFCFLQELYISFIWLFERHYIHICKQMEAMYIYHRMRLTITLGSYWHPSTLTSRTLILRMTNIYFCTKVAPNFKHTQSTPYQFLQIIYNNFSSFPNIKINADSPAVAELLMQIWNVRQISFRWVTPFQHLSNCLLGKIHTLFVQLLSTWYQNDTQHHTQHWTQLFTVFNTLKR